MGIDTGGGYQSYNNVNKIYILQLYNNLFSVICCTHRLTIVRLVTYVGIAGSIFKFDY